MANGARPRSVTAPDAEPVRLEWRHLLRPSAPGTVLLVGTAPALGPALVAAGLADRVLDRPEPAGGADLVVIGPAVTGLDVRWGLDAVAPGGVAYVQRVRGLRPAAGLGALRRRARASGLVEVGTWAALPDHGAPRRYLPLDHGGAFRWYLRYNVVAAHWSTEVARVAMFLIAGCRPVNERLVPATAFVAERPAEGEGPRPESRPPSRPAVLTSGQDAGSRSIVLPFRRRARWPEMVIKSATAPGLDDMIVNEHDRIVDLRSRLPAPLATSLPAPLGLSRLGDSVAATQEVARGPTLWARSGRWPRSRRAAGSDLDLVTRWLIDLGRATRRVGPADPARTWLEEPYRELRSFAPTSEALDRAIDAAAARMRGLRGDLASVTVHYDTGPWNIVRVGDSLKVLDWELDVASGRTGEGPPLTDLLYFVQSWHGLTGGATSARSQVDDATELFFGPALAEPGPAGADGARPDGSQPDGLEPGGRRRPDPIGWRTTAAADVIRRYCGALGVPASATQALLLALWLERAVTSRRRWVRMGPSAAWNDRPLLYLEGFAGASAR